MPFSVSQTAAIVQNNCEYPLRIRVAEYYEKVFYIAHKNGDPAYRFSTVRRVNNPEDEGVYIECCIEKYERDQWESSHE